MTLLDRWLRQPQSVWPRKALFQVHLWTGIGLGLYVLIISLSGSAVVFRNELLRKFSRATPSFTLSGEPLTPEAISEAAKRSFPAHEVDRVIPGKDPGAAVLVLLVRDGDRMPRYFHPSTGEDLGHSQSVSYRAVAWMIDLHDNLLYGRSGRAINGVGAIFATLLALTGAVIWWPGTRKWRRSLLLDWKARGSLFHWSLHSMLGFWFFAFVLLWAISGIYLAFPTPFDALLERLDPVDESSTVPRFGDTFLYWMTRLHFGRWGGIPTKVLWTIFGLVPAVLFVTGAYMWWCRVLRPGLSGGNQQAAPVKPGRSVALEPKTPLTGTPA
jgi:uncharacterized iron-regulated membrane protein